MHHVVSARGCEALHFICRAAQKPVGSVEVGKIGASILPVCTDVVSEGVELRWDPLVVRVRVPVLPVAVERSNLAGRRPDRTPQANAEIAVPEIGARDRSDSD